VGVADVIEGREEILSVTIEVTAMRGGKLMVYSRYKLSFKYTVV